MKIAACLVKGALHDLDQQVVPDKRVMIDDEGLPERSHATMRGML